MCDNNREAKYQIRDTADEVAIKAIANAIDTSRAALNNGKINGGEVFTPHWCVVDMGNMVYDKLDNLMATVFEPACGSGNIIIDVLRRKLAAAYRLGEAQFNENCKWACKSIYGIDISKDNVVQCRERMLSIVKSMYVIAYGRELDANTEKELKAIMVDNVIWGDMIKEQMWNVDTIEAGEDGIAKKAGVTLLLHNWETNAWERLNGQAVASWELANANVDDDEVVDDDDF